ncbi:hypothetical protein K0U83_23540 [bacterium]|nr:hypothetical protein [bacterium]
MAVNNTDAAVASAAMAMIGGAAISSFSDGTTEAEIAESLYEDTVETLLCASRWTFATAQASLNHVAAAPTGRFSDSWQLPTETILQLHAVTSNDYRIEFDVYGSQIYCDYDESNTLVADYTYRPAESLWLPAFKTAVQLQLAAFFAPALRADNDLAVLMQNRADTALRMAKLQDSQQRTSKKVTTNRFLAQRY